MENNGNGRGIFYGVIGVATLVVAIIGATFAYFSATQTGNTFTTGAAEVGLDFSDDVQYMQSNLIPIETGFKDTAQEADDYLYNGAAWNDNLATTFAGSDNVGFNADDAFTCKDTAGYNICSVYEFTISNPGTAPLPLVASIAPTLSDIENLKFAVFRGTVETVEAAGWNVNGTEVDNDTIKTSQEAGQVILKGEAVPGAKYDFANKLDITLAKAGDDGATANYTIMLWVEEIGEKQKSGGTWAGVLTLETEAGTGVTGQIVA